MAVDIYMRDSTDPYFKTGVLEVTDELEMLLGQIKMILYSENIVLGAPDFGVNLEDMLFAQNLNEHSIRSMLRDQVFRFCPLAERYQVSFNVNFTRGTVRDICLIDCLINGHAVFGVLVK